MASLSLFDDDVQGNIGQAESCFDPIDLSVAGLPSNRASAIGRNGRSSSNNVMILFRMTKRDIRCAITRF